MFSETVTCLTLTYQLLVAFQSPLLSVCTFWGHWGVSHQLPQSSSPPSATSRFCVNFWEPMKKHDANFGHLLCIKKTKAEVTLEGLQVSPGPTRIRWLFPQDHGVPELPGVWRRRMSISGTVPQLLEGAWPPVIFLCGDCRYKSDCCKGCFRGAKANTKLFARYVKWIFYFWWSACRLLPGVGRLVCPVETTV